MSRLPVPAPAANVQVNFHEFYTKFAIQRSTNPQGTQSERDESATSIRFSQPGAKALLIDEVGYRAHASGSSRGLWARVGGLYKSSYTDYKSGGMSTDIYALYGAVDYQVLQTGAVAGYRGIYAGLTANYAPSDRNVYSQYYEARVYSIGLWPNRPFDMASLVYSHTHFSQYARADEQLAGVEAFSGSNALTAAYVYRVSHGIYANVGLSYVDRPTFAPERKNALLLLLALNFLL